MSNPETSIDVKLYLYTAYIRTKGLLGLTNRKHTTRLFNALHMLYTNEKIQKKKLGVFLRLCRNQLTRKLVEEVLYRVVIKTDGLKKDRTH